MTTSIYCAKTAEERLADAQRTLDTHITSNANGRCIGCGQPGPLYASAADKIVSLRSILRRASRAPDRAAYWRTRRAFVARVPYFAAFHTAAAPLLPPGMAGELARLVVRAEQATAPLRT